MKHSIETRREQDFLSSFGHLFSAHPASVGENYLQHLQTASYFALQLMVAGLACLAHGLLPFLFASTGSRVVDKLHHAMIADRQRLAKK